MEVTVQDPNSSNNSDCKNILASLFCNPELPIQYELVLA